MDRISNPIKTKEIIDKYDFYFKKNFGQNFIIDQNVLKNIILSAEITKNDFVIEIGPGIGSLTQFLCENAKTVKAIEIDKKLIPILKNTLNEYDNLEIINGDALKIDFNDITEEPFKIVANLPYYITSPIIMSILENKLNVNSITVMVQKEVADRINAKPGTKDYGSLSVAVQFYCESVINFIVPPNCFMPKPKVDSAVITLKPKKNKIEVINESIMFKIIKCAFGQRRKTLLNSIYNQGGFGISKNDILLALSDIGVSPNARGEELSIEQFAALADRIYKIN